MGFIHTMEFYSAIRENETTWFEGKWMQMEDVMLGEKARFKKTKAKCFLSYVGDRTTQT
jgi:hypothetical protein